MDDNSDIEKLGNKFLITGVHINEKVSWLREQ